MHFRAGLFFETGPSMDGCAGSGIGRHCFGLNVFLGGVAFSSARVRGHSHIPVRCPVGVRVGLWFPG